MKKASKKTEVKAPAKRKAIKVVNIKRIEVEFEGASMKASIPKGCIAKSLGLGTLTALSKYFNALVKEKKAVQKAEAK